MRTSTKSSKKEIIKPERVAPFIQRASSWRIPKKPTKTKIHKYRLQPEDARVFLTALIAEEMPEILRGQLELAKGIHMARNIVVDEVTGEVIEAEVYREKPSTESAKYLIDQVIGKAKEKLEINATLRTLVDVVNDLESQEDQLSLAERNKRA